jgi:CBS domain-containing protein
VAADGASARRAIEFGSHAMKVREILKSKGSRVVTVGPHSAVDALVHRLKLEGIGAAVVTEDGSRVDGIVSERDVVRSLAIHGTRVLDMRVSDIMTNVVTCTPEDSVKEVMRRMTIQRVRHLVVMEDAKLAGIVSIGDVVKSRLDEMEMEANVLRDYIVAHQ